MYLEKMFCSIQVIFLFLFVCKKEISRDNFPNVKYFFPEDQELFLNFCLLVKMRVGPLNALIELFVSN